jgi:uncharacterized protein YigE (DUF2233 family)
MKAFYKTCFVATVLMLMSSAKPSSPAAFKATYNQHTFDIYEVDIRTQKITMFWKDNHGEKLKSLSNLKKYVEGRGAQLLFATNAGMYMPDNSPQGLYIENAEKLHSIDLGTNQTGNFYMQPNGVFLVTKGTAKIFTSTAFTVYKGIPLYATQSGPLLVINGSVNSNFKQGSANSYIRSGVGITGDGNVVFAISEEPVNFYDFAVLFRDVLKCSKALYLDGAISKMYLPALNRYDADGSFGAMIAVTK